MVRLIVFSLCLFSVNSIFSQSYKNERLDGKWYSPNMDSMFYQSSKVVFYKSISYKNNYNNCYLIEWDISGKNLNYNYYDLCSYPDDVFKINGKWRIYMKNINSHTFINIKLNNSIIERYRIDTLYHSVELNSNVLELKRIGVEN